MKRAPKLFHFTEKCIAYDKKVYHKPMSSLFSDRNTFDFWLSKWNSLGRCGGLPSYTYFEKTKQKELNKKPLVALSFEGTEDSYDGEEFFDGSRHLYLKNVKFAEPKKFVALTY